MAHISNTRPQKSSRSQVVSSEQIYDSLPFENMVKLTDIRQLFK